MESDTIMLNGSCHCGAVKFELLIQPTHLTECNCSICHRIGAIWAHADDTEINIICDETDLINYVWGDKSIKFCSCKTCGCTTHWKSLGAQQPTRLVVNMRMVDRAEILEIGIRHFDGADSFVYLD